MPNLFGLGEEMESIIAGVVGYFVAGILIFFACFVLNKFFIWHRRRMLRKKRKEQGLDDDDVMTDLNQAVSLEDVKNHPNGIHTV